MPEPINTVSGSLENIFANGCAASFEASGPPDNGIWQVGIAKYPAGTLDTIELHEEYPGTWIESQGDYLISYSYPIENGSICEVGYRYGLNVYNEVSATFFYCQPLTPRFNTGLDLCPVGSEGVAAGYLNVAVSSPELVTTDWTLDEFGEPQSSSSTDTAPSLVADVAGVTYDEEGKPTYTSLPCKNPAGAVLRDGVLTEIDATDFCKVYADTRHDYNGYLLRLVPDGFAPEEGEVVGIPFLRRMLFKLWTNDTLSYNQATQKWEGGVTLKYLKHGVPVLGNGHIEFDASKFYLPPGMRVN